MPKQMAQSKGQYTRKEGAIVGRKTLRIPSGSSGVSALSPGIKQTEPSMGSPLPKEGAPPSSKEEPLVPAQRAPGCMV